MTIILFHVIDIFIFIAVYNVVVSSMSLISSEADSQFFTGYFGIFIKRLFLAYLE